jgi:hypothetical protein
MKQAPKINALPVHHFEEKERIAKLVTSNFGISSTNTPPPIDTSLMVRLCAALSQIDEDLREACWQRGLLPTAMSESLRMAGFLSFTLPLARAAQHSTGVPASVLIAEAYNISGIYFYGDHFQLPRPDSNDLFETGKRYGSMLDAFIQHAQRLSEDSKFIPVMRSLNSAEYIDQLARWSSKKYNVELVNTVTAHSLTECDQMRPAF